MSQEARNFLIIDDSKFMRKMMEKLLIKLGHNVIAQASNGHQAVDVYLDNWYDIDVILLDVVLPKVDGLQILKQILEINPFAKVCMVTSISSLSIVNRCMAAGAIEFVVKPFRISEFVRAIESITREIEQKT